MESADLREMSLGQEELRTEASALISSYKTLLLRSQSFQRATALSFLSVHDEAAWKDSREIKFQVNNEHSLEVKYIPNKSLSLKLRGDDDATLVELEPGTPLIRWSYKNDDQRRKERVYENTRDAIGNSNQSLSQLELILK